MQEKGLEIGRFEQVISRLRLRVSFGTKVQVVKPEGETGLMAEEAGYIVIFNTYYGGSKTNCIFFTNSFLPYTGNQTPTQNRSANVEDSYPTASFLTSS
jgi:hypothetical protein